MQIILVSFSFLSRGAIRFRKAISIRPAISLNTIKITPITKVRLRPKSVCILMQDIR
jgi:hypothetical protein